MDVPDLGVHHLGGLSARLSVDQREAWEEERGVHRVVSWVR